MLYLDFIFHYSDYTVLHVQAPVHAERMAPPTLWAAEWGDSAHAENKAENKHPTNWAHSWPVHPLLSF